MFKSFFYSAKASFLTMAGAITLASVLSCDVNAQVQFNPVGSFSSPVHITHAGDSRLFIVEKVGNIRIVDGGSTLGTAFLDISTLVSGGSEQGLLSLAFHPDYGVSSDYFFVNYTDTSGDTVIARYEVSGDPNVANSASASILMTIPQPFSNHNGGQIAFGPDGYLYIGMGDGGSANDPGCRAQDGSTLLGKMLRIDVDQNVGSAPFHGIPADNPFIADGAVLDEIWQTGLRNPWRFSFDRSTGDLWVADVGQNNIEEINMVPAASTGGENYGWKIMEGDACFSTSACTSPIPCNDPAFTDPVEQYTHTGGRCSITGGIVYRGSMNPDFVGQYIYADYCSAEIFIYDPGTDTSTLLENRSSVITSFGEDVNGEVYVANGGTVYQIESLAGVTDWDAEATSK